MEKKERVKEIKQRKRAKYGKDKRHKVTNDTERKQGGQQYKDDIRKTEKMTLK